MSSPPSPSKSLCTYVSKFDKEMMEIEEELVKIRDSTGSVGEETMELEKQLLLARAKLVEQIPNFWSNVFSASFTPCRIFKNFFMHQDLNFIDFLDKFDFEECDKQIIFSFGFFENPVFRSITVRKGLHKEDPKMCWNNADEIVWKTLTDPEEIQFFDWILADDLAEKNPMADFLSVVWDDAWTLFKMSQGFPPSE